jgi:3-hydroxyisobutyrate dehydrogenase-like beta-hydroxyacid dehydrogenase
MQRIGFIGIGLMGSQMSRKILEAKYPLTVWNRKKEKAGALISAGAKWADSPKAVAQASDVAITMVTDSTASEEVICGKNGVLEGAHPGLILIDMGSIAPEMSRSIADRARARGIPMLDAPVTGNPKVASEGKLGIMVGGPKETFDACLPIFEKMGIKIIHVGETEKGRPKLINNLIMGWHRGRGRGLVLASKRGSTPESPGIASVGGPAPAPWRPAAPDDQTRLFPHFSASNMHRTFPVRNSPRKWGFLPPHRPGNPAGGESGQGTSTPAA